MIRYDDVRCGDHVRNKIDPRHWGIIVACNYDRTVRVLWNDTGWRSDENVSDLTYA